MKDFITFFMLLSLCCSTAASATNSNLVTYDSRDDFERGTLKNVSISFDSHLQPALSKKLLFDTGDPFIWSLALDSKDNIYLGTGNDGRLYKISADGDTSIFFDAMELGVYALAIDDENNIYAGTAPNGKVYKITSSGESSVFYKPDAGYIWSLLIEKSGDILLATGEPATIVRINKKGESSTIFIGQENHVRTMVSGSNGEIIAGTSGKGFIYKIEENKKPFVIYDPSQEEINGLVFGSDGMIFASVFGQSLMPILPEQITQQKKTTSSTNGDDDDQENEVSLSPQSISIDKLSRIVTAPTSLFRITKDGYAKDLWMGMDETIQSIYPAKGGVYIGSGKNGKIYEMNKEGKLSLLFDNEESHISGFAMSNNGNLVITTSNMGRCYLVENKVSSDAIYESETIDAGLTALWGTLDIEGNEDKKGLQFFTRSGNTEQPQTTWSEWQPMQEDENLYRIESPSARFVQWKCEFKHRDSFIKRVTLSYQQKNCAPEVTSILVHPPGDYYEAKRNDDKKGIIFPAPATNKQDKKGFRTLDWLFEDANFDALIFSLFYRVEGQKLWHKMETELGSNIYCWDTTQMADGKYQVKIVASDAPSNPDGNALSGEKMSDTFIIDNSGPQCEKFILKNENSQKVALFSIRDSWSILKSVEYSLDAQDWQAINPADFIYDSKVENFRLVIPDQESHHIAIKSQDVIGNFAVFYQTIE